MKNNDKLLLKLFDRAFGENVVIDRKQFNHRLSRMGMELINQAFCEMKNAGLIETKKRGARLYNKKSIL